MVTLRTIYLVRSHLPEIDAIVKLGALDLVILVILRSETQTDMVFGNLMELNGQFLERARIPGVLVEIVQGSEIDIPVKANGRLHE